MSFVHDRFAVPDTRSYVDFATKCVEVSSRDLATVDFAPSGFDEAVVTYLAPADSMTLFPIERLRFSNYVEGLVIAVRAFITFAFSDVLHSFLPRPTYGMTRTANA